MLGDSLAKFISQFDQRLLSFGQGLELACFWLVWQFHWRKHSLLKCVVHLAMFYKNVVLSNFNSNLLSGLVGICAL